MMFYNLSEKALDKIRELMDLHPIDGLSVYECMEPVKAFLSLFDLDKYPVTWHQVLEYAKQNQNFEFGGNLQVIEDKIIIYHPYRDGTCDTYEYIDVAQPHIVRVVLGELSTALGRDFDYIIGVIHGWWVKGDAQ